VSPEAKRDRQDLSGGGGTERSVRHLAEERPDWLDVLGAAATVAREAEGFGGEFAGARVVEQLHRRGERRRVPNLRLLVSYGLLEKVGTTTMSGRRAYYCMPDREGVEDALERVRAQAGSSPPAGATARGGRGSLEGAFEGVAVVGAAKEDQLFRVGLPGGASLSGSRSKG